MKLLVCAGCGCKIPDDIDFNIYYPYQGMISDNYSICNDCLDFIMNLCFVKKPTLVIKEHEMANTKFLYMPFTPNSWLVVHCSP